MGNAATCESHYEAFDPTFYYQENILAWTFAKKKAKISYTICYYGVKMCYAVIIISSV